MLRVGIMGLGGMGRGRLRYYGQMPEAQVVAVADIRVPELKQDGSLAELFGVPLPEVRWFDTYRELAASGTVDVVDICLPTPHHSDAAIAALEGGLHVLCEKPMALSPAACAAMLAASQRAGRLLMIAQCIRFWPEYQVVADLLHSGTVGRLLALQLSRQGPTPGPGSWFSQAAQSGGALLDLHIHDVYYCQYLLGLPARIYAQGGMSVNAVRGYDYVRTNLDYPGGPQVSILAQWVNASVPFVAAYEARFEHAFLRYDGSQTPTLSIYREGIAQPEHPAPVAHDAYFSEIRYFLDCVGRAVQPERCPPVQSRNAVGLIAGVRASIERRALVAVDEFVP
jgi:1,5-anhydro-D-fructose reductase (1,5-anhydro-D-mannitol-forming)